MHFPLPSSIAFVSSARSSSSRQAGRVPRSIRPPDLGSRCCVYFVLSIVVQSTGSIRALRCHSVIGEVDSQLFIRKVFGNRTFFSIVRANTRAQCVKSSWIPSDVSMTVIRKKTLTMEPAGRTLSMSGGPISEGRERLRNSRRQRMPRSPTHLEEFIQVRLLIVYASIYIECDTLRVCILLAKFSCNLSKSLYLNHPVKIESPLEVNLLPLLKAASYIMSDIRNL